MKKNEIKCGSYYTAKVNGKIVTVRVDSIETTYSSNSLRYHVTNTETGRTTTFRSAAKFRGLVDGSLRDPRPGLRGESRPHVHDASCYDREDDGAVHLACGQEAVSGPAAGFYTCTNCGGSVELSDGDSLPADDEGCEHDWVRQDQEASEEADPTSPKSSGMPFGARATPTSPATERPLNADEVQRMFEAKDIAAAREEERQARATYFSDSVHAEGLKGDQMKAFCEITDRLRAHQRIVKLCGYAGSGKTFLLARIAKWAQGQGRKVTVAAPTHKAAGVIAEKLGDKSISVRTIHSVLGLQLAPDYENDSGGRILAANEGGKSKVKEGLVICDESSMCGSILKEHIEAQARNVCWLFVGDLAQLPPVGESISELLNNPDCTLNEVLRQARGSEILNLATRIRGGDLSMAHAAGKDVFQVSDAEELFQQALSRFDSPEYQADPSYCRMLVFRNARRAAINLRMRKLLVGSERPYEPGEWLVMYAQFSPGKSKLNIMASEARKYTKGDRGYGRAWKRFFEAKERMGDLVESLHVSQEVRIEDVTESTIDVADQTFNVWKLSVVDKDHNPHELPVLKAEEVNRHQVLLATLAGKARELRKEQDALVKDSPTWNAKDVERKRVWSTYFSLEETFALVDYSYAMTTHKAQGSTLDHVFIDVPDLMSSGGMQARILYTAVTRAAKSVTFYN